tara:strand:+ start:685 stop:879 length:195 start_codon:yes stop_codon:yes gene_type:complete
MIDREAHKKLSDDYDNLKGKYNQIIALYTKSKAEAGYWEENYKILRESNERLEAQVRLWRGTGL